MLVSNEGRGVLKCAWTHLSGTIWFNNCWRILMRHTHLPFITADPNILQPLHAPHLSQDVLCPSHLLTLDSTHTHTHTSHLTHSTAAYLVHSVERVWWRKEGMVIARQTAEKSSLHDNKNGSFVVRDWRSVREIVAPLFLLLALLTTLLPTYRLFSWKGADQGQYKITLYNYWYSHSQKVCKKRARIGLAIFI